MPMTNRVRKVLRRAGDDVSAACVTAPSAAACPRKSCPSRFERLACSAPSAARSGPSAWSWTFVLGSLKPGAAAERRGTDRRDDRGIALSAAMYAVRPVRTAHCGDEADVGLGSMIAECRRDRRAEHVGDAAGLRRGATACRGPRC